MAPCCRVDQSHRTEMAAAAATPKLSDQSSFRFPAALPRQLRRRGQEGSRGRATSARMMEVVLAYLVCSHPPRSESVRSSAHEVRAHGLERRMALRWSAPRTDRCSRDMHGSARNVNDPSAWMD